jgi:phage terminase large subunit GpA-like protein
LVTHRDRQGYAKREWQKLRERNDALDCYVYARAAAAAAGLDRFEERHWRELERPLGAAETHADPPSSLPMNHPHAATPSGGLVVSGTRSTGRQVFKSRWMG